MDLKQTVVLFYKRTVRNKLELLTWSILEGGSEWLATLTSNTVRTVWTISCEQSSSKTFGGNVSDYEPVQAEISFPDPEKSNDDCKDHNEKVQMRTDSIGGILRSPLHFRWGKSTWYRLIHASSSSQPKIKFFHITRSYVPSRMYGSFHGYSRCRPRELGWSFATWFADICLFLPMIWFMSLQVGSWSERFTTELVYMCHLPTMEKFMHLQVSSWSEWFNTELAKTSAFYQQWKISCIFKSIAGVNDLPQNLRTCAF